MSHDPKRCITVVSGLPRSGTSLMMRMLEAGGLPALSDGERAADVDNPRGYYELEEVKRTARDAAWLRRAEGKVVKVISYLLGDLPADRHYRIVFMRRSLDEILVSQRKMLINRGEPVYLDDAKMKDLFVQHLTQVEEWLRRSTHVEALYVSYARTIAEPERQAARVNTFLGGHLRVEAMVHAVEPGLYRNRVAPAG